MDTQHLQEILHNPTIRDLEIEILNYQWKYEHHGFDWTTEKECVKVLLDLRKKALDRMFVLYTKSKQLLTEFNNTMSDAVLKVAYQVEQVWKQNKDLIGNDICVVSKCFLGYAYPKIHPVQTNRSKKMWAVLSGTIDGYCPLYIDGVIMGCYKANGNSNVYDEVSQNNILYLQDETDNWNEGLDSEITKDMHLTHQYHNLYGHTCFSIFDLLWVRSFEIETIMEHDCSVGGGSDGDDL